jgi:transcriptional regulator with XRE-family HTH domain
MNRQASADQFIRELVGRNVKSARLEAGMSQRELGERVAGGERQRISLWENGRVQPSFQSLIDIAAVTGHDLGWFFTEHAEPQPAAPAA